MSLYRTEFNKTIVRLKLIQDELLEKGFEETVQNLSQVLTLLNQTDNSYIQELAKQKAQTGHQTKSQPC